MYAQPMAASVPNEPAAGPVTGVPWTPKDLLYGFLLWFAAIAVALLIGLLLLQTSQSLALAVAESVAEAALILPVWLVAVRKYRLTWKDVGLRGFSWGLLGLGCLGLAVFYLFNLCYASLLAVFNLQVEPQLIQQMGNSTQALPLLIAGLFVAPISEELFFRGFLYAGLRERIGVAWAAILSAGLFSLAHVTPTAIPSLFVIGLIFALLYERGRSIWPSAIMHTTINVIGLLAAYFVANYLPVPGLP